MAFAANNVNESMPFDDVDLFEAEYHSSNVDSTSADKTNNIPCISEIDDMEATRSDDSVHSKSQQDFTNAAIETDQVESMTKNFEEEISSSLSAEVDESADRIIDNRLAVTAEPVSVTDHNSENFSSKVANADGKKYPAIHSADDGCLETSTAVLTLDSDNDSPVKQRTDCEDGIELNVAVLQERLAELLAERDDYKSLYTQSVEEIENYQEEILQVRTH